MESEMNKQFVVVCEDSLEGVFSAIYKLYEKKFCHEKTRLMTQECETYELFTEYISFEPDEVLAEKVIRTVIREFGEKSYTSMCYALSGTDEGKANAVYQMIVFGLKLKNKRNLINAVTNDSVNQVFCLAREAGNEVLRLKEFLRFRELENGVLFAKIAPKHNLLTFLVPHFADRFLNENFVIYDEHRNLAAIHPAYQEYVLLHGTEYDAELVHHFSKAEAVYAELFQLFCKTISIRERENKRLQMQMLPLRYRKYMTEFNAEYL